MSAAAYSLIDGFQRRRRSRRRRPAPRIHKVKGPRAISRSKEFIKFREGEEEGLIAKLSVFICLRDDDGYASAERESLYNRCIYTSVTPGASNSR